MDRNRYRNNYSSRGYHGFSSNDPLPPKKNKHMFEKVLLIGLLLFIVCSVEYNHVKKFFVTKAEQTEKIIQSIFEEEEVENFPVTSINTEEDFYDMTTESSVSTLKKKERRTTALEEDYDDFSSLDNIERKTHESVV